MWFLFDGEMRGSSLEEERSWKLPLLKRKLPAPLPWGGNLSFLQDAELGLRALSDEWLLRAAKFWNNLAALPPGNVHRCMALDSCKSAIGPRNRRKNWAGSMYRAVINTGYQLAIRLDDMDAIDITALRHFITQRRDAVWEGLDVCPRTCPSAGARLCTYAAWFARPPHKHGHC